MLLATASFTLTGENTLTDLELMRGLAAKFHAEQMYGPYPYTYHLDAVEKMVTEAYPNDDRLPIIAQGHDTLEDTKANQVLLRSLFDGDIVDAIVAMTKHPDEDSMAYLNRVKKNSLAHKVKICDSFCNLRESVLRNEMRRIKKYGHYLEVLAS